MSRAALVTGGAGFVGSHLCERLLADGWTVTCMDNLSTGHADNIAPFLSEPGFRFIQVDLAEDELPDTDAEVIFHLASPASPLHYARMPIATMKVGAFGTYKVLELARAREARVLLASTSEVYGDPEIHPQPESYWGRVNPIGPRSQYDEGKRFAEALCAAYHRTYGTEIRMARIFNTYGPRMQPGEGRAVPTFVEQALRGHPLTIHGDGSQTRSFCYVSDLIEGLLRLALSDVEGPVNLGNPDERPIRELAELIIELTGSSSPIEFVPRPPDDPSRRRPDITRARTLLGWQPTIDVREGLATTIEWARNGTAAPAHAPRGERSG
jgi:nucleoside-diphosphate-sugar epimerase